MALPVLRRYVQIKVFHVQCHICIYKVVLIDKYYTINYTKPIHYLKFKLTVVNKKLRPDLNGHENHIPVFQYFVLQVCLKVSNNSLMLFRLCADTKRSTWGSIFWTPLALGSNLSYRSIGFIQISY